MSTRTRRCELRLTESEYTALTKKAQAAGLSVRGFIRKAINRCEIKAAPPADLPMFIREIRRVGINIDQILMVANARGLLDVPRLRRAMADLREVEAMVLSTYK